MTAEKGIDRVLENNYKGGYDDVNEIERIVREGGNAMLAEKDESGWIALHHALNWKCTGRVAILLARLTSTHHPALLTQGDKGGVTALHYAMSNKHPEEVVTCLLQLSPKAASVEDKGGHLPLYSGLDNNAPPPAVMAVLAAHPAAATNPKMLENHRSKLVKLVGLGNQALGEQVVSEMQRSDGWVPTDFNAWYTGVVGQFVRSNPADGMLRAAIDAGASAAVLLTVLAAQPGTEDAKTQKYRSKLAEAVGLGNQALFEQVVSNMQRGDGWAPTEINARYTGVVGQFVRSNPADGMLRAAIDAGASAAVLLTVLAAQPGTEDAKTQKYRSKLVEAVGLGNQALFEQVVSNMQRGDGWAPTEINARCAGVVGQFVRSNSADVSTLLSFAIKNHVPAEVAAVAWRAGTVSAILEACPDAVIPGDGRLPDAGLVAKRILDLQLKEAKKNRADIKPICECIPDVAAIISAVYTTPLRVHLAGDPELRKSIEQDFELPIMRALLEFGKIYGKLLGAGDGAARLFAQLASHRSEDEDKKLYDSCNVKHEQAAPDEHRKYCEEAVRLAAEANSKVTRAEQLQPLRSLIGVLVAATANEQEFNAAITALGESAGAKSLFAIIKGSTLKGVLRLIEKAVIKAVLKSRETLVFDDILDVLRGMLVGGDDSSSFLDDTRTVSRCQKAVYGSSTLVVCRAKPRVDEAGDSAKTTGWRDELLNVTLRGRSGLVVIGEIQIVRYKMLNQRELMGGHDGYDKVRGLMGLSKILVALGFAPAPTELEFAGFDDAGPDGGDEVVMLRAEVAKLRAENAELKTSRGAVGAVSADTSQLTIKEKAKVAKMVAKADKMFAKANKIVASTHAFVQKKSGGEKTFVEFS